MKTGNRKFWVTMTALMGAIVLAFLGKLTAEYAMVASICVGAFAAANAFEHKFNGPVSDGTTRT